MDLKKYLVEQINVSDNEYELTYINVINGDKIKKGDPILSYESSKADFEIIADFDGYCYLKPALKVGNSIKVGEYIACLSENEINDSNIFTNINNKSSEIIDSDITITKKARLLIEKNNIKIESLDFSNEIITEFDVKKFLSKNETDFSKMDFYYNKDKFDIEINFPENPKKKIAVVGAGKSALQILDILYHSDKLITIFYDEDDKLTGKKLFGIEIFKFNTKQILDDFNKGLFDEIIVSFSSDLNNRKLTFQSLKKLSIPIPNLIHPHAYISPTVKIGEGNIIFAKTIVNAFSEIGSNNFISSFCNIEHHNYLGSHNTFGPGVMFSGSCKIHDSCKFGTGIFIEPRVVISSDCIISSGSIIQKNLKVKTLVRTKITQEYKDLK